MIITNEVSVHLDRSADIPELNAVQGDSARAVAISLLYGKTAWAIPENTTAMIRYYNSRTGSGGSYDTMPDGTAAYSISENQVIVHLPAQVFSAQGTVRLQVTLLQDGAEITVFMIKVRVQQNLTDAAVTEEDYDNLTEHIRTEVDAAVQALDITGTVWVKVTQDGGVFAADKTFVELYAAYQEGQAVYCLLGNEYVLPLVGASDTSVVFQETLNREYQRVVISAENAITYTSERYALYEELPVAGMDGKSAYEYAQDGGYSGTEEEFSAKLAEEIPVKVSQLENDSNYAPRSELRNPLYVNITAAEDGSLKAEATNAEINAAVMAKRAVCCMFDGLVFQIAQADSRSAVFIMNASDFVLCVDITDDVVTWEEWPLVLPEQIPTKVSQLTNDSGYLTSAPVASVNGKTGAVSLSAVDVGALPDSTEIPTVPSTLPNPHKLVFTGVVNAEYDGSGAVTVEIPAAKADTETVLSDNLFDKSTAVTGSIFYHGSSGPSLVAQSTGFYAYVPLRGAGIYHTVINSVQHGADYAQRVPILKEDQSFLQNVMGTLTAIDDSYSYLEFTVTDTMIDAGAAVYAFDGSAFMLDTLMIVKDREYPSEYIPYGYIEAEHAQSVNILSGKTAVFLGDSICAGTTTLADAPEYGYGWAGLIGEANAMTWGNFGRNGGTITPVESVEEARWLPTQVDEAVAAHPAVDYVIFEGGTNDADTLGADGLGAFSVSGYDPTGDADFTGAFETLVLKILNTYPNAKVGYIVAPKMGAVSDYSSDNNTRRKFFDRAVEICQKWGIPVLDLWKCNPMNPKLSVYYDSSLTADEANTNGKCYTDGQHLTLSGYQRITPMIEAFMRGL